MQGQALSDYPGPISSERKPWSRRIEVFSPKLERRLMLLSHRCHDAWVLLEADPRVRRFCERPEFLEDGTRRVVDLWVNSGRHKHFLVVARPDEDGREWPKRVLGLPLRVWKPDVIDTQQVAIFNWGQMIPYLSIYRRAREAGLEDEVLARLRKPHRLMRLEMAFHPIEPGRLRAALFRLLATGKVVADGIDCKPLNGSTLFRRSAA